jgi:D-aminopeptidase
MAASMILRVPAWFCHALERVAEGRLKVGATRADTAMPSSSFLFLFLLVATFAAAAEGDDRRPRTRDIGIAPGVFPPGPFNAITDVDGVRVGHATIHQGDEIHTGVTAVLPHGGNLFQEKVAAGVFVGNAFGKLAGSTQVQELGTLETPIVLTNTLAVGTAVEAVVSHALAQTGNESIRSVNAVVGETNDAGLSDIRRLPVTRDHVLAAIRDARGGPVAEGSVGAGTGTQCFGWKGGIGTSSRRLPERFGGHTLGVLVQANFGGVLTIAGAPVGKELGRYSFAPPAAKEEGTGDGSCMIIVATDAPIDARDLHRLAARAVFGMARTGASYSNGSGDFALAFSTSPEARSRHGATEPIRRTLLPPDALSPLFQAALEATEEAIDNALLQATPVRYRGHTVEAIPIGRVQAILKTYGRTP